EVAARSGEIGHRELLGSAWTDATPHGADLRRPVCWPIKSHQGVKANSPGTKASGESLVPALHGAGCMRGGGERVHPSGAREVRGRLARGANATGGVLRGKKGKRRCLSAQRHPNEHPCVLHDTPSSRIASVPLPLVRRSGWYIGGH